MRKVIFDIDDTAWAFNDRVCSILGIDINKIKNFSISKNDELSEEEKHNILSMYANGETFDNMELYDGFIDIMQLEQYNCEVHINSNCVTADVRDKKYEQLVNKFGFPKEKIKLNIITDHTDKEIQEDAFILVDDSPFNIAKSTAKYNIALRKPWNTSEVGKEIIGDKPVIFCDTFLEVLDIIKELLTKEQ